MRCPCCENEFDNIELYDICDNCGWEYDPIQNDNEKLRGGANILSLNDCQKIYRIKNEFSAEKVLTFAHNDSSDKTLKTIILGLNATADKRFSKAVHDEKFLLKMLKLGVRYFKIAVFKLKAENGIFYACVGKNHVQVIDEIVENITEFSRSGGERCVIEISFDADNSKSEYRELDKEERFEVISKLAASGYFDKEKQVDNFYDSPTDIKSILIVRDSSSDAFADDIKSKLTDFNSYEFDLDMNADIHGRLSEYAAFCENFSIFKLNVDTEKLKKHGVNQSVVIQHLIASNRLLPKLTIICFDEYVNDRVAIFTVIKENGI